MLAQVYENWELLLIDDGSTATDLLGALPALAARAFFRFGRVVVSVVKGGRGESIVC